MKFSKQAWRETSDLFQRTLDLPFNRELAAGTLSTERFRFYIMQDAIYLVEYARALSAASAKAPDMDALQFYAQSADRALAVERILHGGFLKQFGIELDHLAAAEPSPTCLGYTNFLLATAQRDAYAALASAVLPCFWIYWEVGNHISRIAAPDNPYQAWIDTYADPGFGEAVKTAIEMCDRAAAAASPDERALMMDLYKRSAQYEWMFWDSAYRLEAWPVTP